MPNFREHFKHSKSIFPEVEDRIHEYVHRWMDNPATWEKGQLFENGNVRRHGYGPEHRNIRHDPKKVADALCGGNKELWHIIYAIADDHLMEDYKNLVF